jgi:hypothetical protein
VLRLVHLSPEPAHRANRVKPGVLQGIQGRVFHPHPHPLPQGRGLMSPRPSGERVRVRGEVGSYVGYDISSTVSDRLSRVDEICPAKIWSSDVNVVGVFCRGSTAIYP